MHEMIQEYAKRLKLSWIRENFHTVDIEDPKQYLLTLFEKEVNQREERLVRGSIRARVKSRVNNRRKIY